MNGTDDTDRKADESRRQAPLPTPAPPPANDAEVLGGTEGNPTGTRETETEQLLRGTRTIEILQFTANAALAVIGIVALYIYSGQLGVMRGQLSEIHAGSTDTHVLAEAAKKQADKAETISESIKLAVKAMQDSAAAATSSADTAKQILESSTRPYMGSDTASLDNNPTGHHLSYGFHMKNFSGAPAYNAVFRWCPSITGYPPYRRDAVSRQAHHGLSRPRLRLS